MASEFSRCAQGLEVLWRDRAATTAPRTRTLMVMAASTTATGKGQQEGGSISSGWDSIQQVLMNTWHGPYIDTNPWCMYAFPAVISRRLHPAESKPKCSPYPKPERVHPPPESLADTSPKQSLQFISHRGRRGAWWQTRLRSVHTTLHFVHSFS